MYKYFLSLRRLCRKNTVDPSHPMQFLREKKDDVYPLAPAQTFHLFSTFSTKEIILTYGASTF